MTTTHRKKISRQRGYKWHGYGSKKKHRGGGSRGGRGNSGMMKHKKSWMVQNDPDHFGRSGFTSFSSDVETINLIQLDTLARVSGTEINLTELGFDKLLGTGKVTQALKVTVAVATPKAREKIEKAGGSISELVAPETSK